MYQERDYRNRMKSEDLVSYKIYRLETDLFVSTDIDLMETTKRLVNKYRTEIEVYAKINPDFITSLKPIIINESVPSIVSHMSSVAQRGGVGPMAAVAGAISQYVGQHLMDYSENVIIENGGDLFIKTNITRKIRIFAGDSLFSNKLNLIISPDETPLGICTSSGTIGHSFSYGKADAVVVVSEDTLLADACATATCNIIQGKDDINKGIEFIKTINDIKGCIIIKDDKLGIWGDIRISK